MSPTSVCAETKHVHITHCRWRRYVHTFIVNIVVHWNKLSPAAINLKVKGNTISIDISVENI